MWIKKKKGVSSAQKLHTLGIVILFNIISHLDDVSYHLSEFIFIHKNQVVFGTLFLITLMKDEKGTLILHSWSCSHEKSFLKYCWMLGQPFTSLQRQRQMLSRSIWFIFPNWVKLTYQRTWEARRNWGQMGPPPTFPLHLDKQKAVTWVDTKSDLSASPNFPSGGFHRLDWAKGACALKSKHCYLIQPLP